MPVNLPSFIVLRAEEEALLKTLRMHARKEATFHRDPAMVQFYLGKKSIPAYSSYFLEVGDSGCLTSENQQSYFKLKMLG